MTTPAREDKALMIGGITESYVDEAVTDSGMAAKRQIIFSSLSVVTAGVVYFLKIEILFAHSAVNPKLNMRVVPSK